MKIIRGTGDAKRLKGQVVGGVRTLKCTCGRQALPSSDSKGKTTYTCACGKKFGVQRM